MRKLKEPCMNHNPWDGYSTFGHPRPASPCGRPKGHPPTGAGGGSRWGDGHSEKPGPEDPLTKEIVMVPYSWKVKD